MNLSKDSFYLVINFKSSIEEYYQDNVINDFRVKLNKPIRLCNALWKVALCEIHVVNVLLDKEISHDEYTFLQVEFETCEGILVDGKPTHTLRMIPYEANTRSIFTYPFYVPMHTGDIDSCHILVKVVSNKPVQIRQLDNSCITCTLHFKKCGIGYL